jgi:hypothetical protein
LVGRHSDFPDLLIGIVKRARQSKSAQDSSLGDEFLTALDHQGLTAFSLILQKAVELI